MKLTILATILSTAAAFVPAPESGRTSTADSDNLNGWVPDESEFAWGLPGSLAPAGEFDPLGFAKDTPLATMKQWREAEVQHSCVAMLAALGMLVTEEPFEYHHLFEAYEKDIGPAIRHLDEVHVLTKLVGIGFDEN